MIMTTKSGKHANSVLPLAGHFHEFDGEERSIEVARRIEHPDGHSTIIVEYSDVDEEWEMRLESRDGRLFSGMMKSPEWDLEYSVRMELWRATDDEFEWLLLGVYGSEGEGETDWAINLWEEEPE